MMSAFQAVLHSHLGNLEVSGNLIKFARFEFYNAPQRDR